MKPKTKLVQTANGTNYLVPFVLITTLFFLWGFAHSILDVLNKHFQDALSISKTHSALIQAVVYGGYFLMAMPAGEIIRRYGYRTGVITGLILYGIGALLFIPGEQIMSFPFFLFSLFVIGCGLTCLELAQSFNGLGWICGPLVGGLFIFTTNKEESSVAIPYAIIGTLVLLAAILFSRIRLPEIKTEEPVTTAQTAAKRSLWSQGNFVFGLIALFFYVAAQTGINSFFINYVTEQTTISAREAALWLSFVGMGLFMAGRMTGSWVMGFVRSERLLASVAIGGILSMIVVMAGLGKISIGAFFFCFLCESIMFPTIFALAIRGVGEHTKRASSYLIMSIVGGAVAPLIMGYIADTVNTATGFIVPLICFAIITVFALYLQKH